MKNSIKSTTSLALVLGLVLLTTPSFASDSDDMGKEGNLVCGDCDFSGENLTAYTIFSRPDCERLICHPPQ